MADRSPAPDTPELRERWNGFEFTDVWRERADTAKCAPVKYLAKVDMSSIEGADDAR